MRYIAEAYVLDMTGGNPAPELRVVDNEADQADQADLLPAAADASEAFDAEAVPETESDEVAEAFDLATKAAFPWLNDPLAQG